MFSSDYLHLRLVRLQANEEMPLDPCGFTFIAPKGGSGKFVSRSVTHRLASGDVLLANATEGGKVCATGGGELVFWCFVACLENLFPLFGTSEISLLQTVTDEIKAGKLYVASTPAATDCQRLLADVPPQADLGHRSQLLRIIATLLSVEFKKAHGQRVGYVSMEKHVVQVFETLSSAEILEASVGELAAKFGCSRRHLNRLFHQHFGFSVATLRMEMRLLKAVSLLRNPDTKIITVAEECGFNHLGLFNTCFKRRFGASPGQWRKTETPPKNPPLSHHANGLLCPLRSSGLCPSLGDQSQAGAVGEKLGMKKTGVKATLKIAPGLEAQALSIRDLRDELGGPNAYRASA